MPAQLMRMFGKSTKAQLTILGIVLLVLGAVGAFGVMFMSNEEPVSLIFNPNKVEYYNGVSIWAIFAFSLVAVAGLLVVGIAYTGLPFVYMAKYHMGVFYVGLFSLVIIPSAIALRMGTTLMANASADTFFAKGLTDQVFTSPSGLLAVVVAAALLGLSLFIVFINMWNLAKVSHRSSTVKGATVACLVLVAVVVVTYALLPTLVALEFNHERGFQGAVGFEGFDPKDVLYPAGWLKWLSAGEHSSTYGSMSSWLTMISFMLFLGIVVSVVGFMGLALYSANDRKPNTFSLTIAPLAVLVFAILAILFYSLYNGALADMAERLNVDSENTKISYLAGNMAIQMAMNLVILGAGAFFTITIKEWIQMMSKGRTLTDPISMESLVDPPTDLPIPPTGWPARWDRMSTANMIVVGVAAILVLAGIVGGFSIKGGEDLSSDFNIDKKDDEVILKDLKEEERVFRITDDYANEGETKQFMWQPDGVWFIKSMELVVRWIDETPYFRHENMPDTFESVINASTGEEFRAQGSSSSTSLMGEMRLPITFDKYILTTDVTGLVLPPEVVEGEINVTLTLVECGDQPPVGAGFYTFPDNGNLYSAELIVKYKVLDQS